MNSIGYFEIQVINPKRAMAFYKAVFGWSFKRGNLVPREYYHIEGGGMMGGLLKREAPSGAPRKSANAFVCSMEVENFDGTAKKILAKGGNVAFPKMAIPGRCWQGYFLDTEKNVFGIFQVDEDAK